VQGQAAGAVDENREHVVEELPHLLWELSVRRHLAPESVVDEVLDDEV
jgi:hypothetical protein